MRRQQETTCAAGGIDDALTRRGTHHIDHGLDERARREVLTRAAFGVFSVLLQQTLVGIAFDIGIERGPGFAVDEVYDEAAQVRGVLNFVEGLANLRKSR